MTEQTIYRDIAKRSDGDIYIGVVGPVRVGKSTFIRRFLESTVLPNISDTYDRERTLDSMPQAASGKTVMTTEPKFIPDEAVRVVMQDQTAFNVRLIDCVGYLVPEALGQMENGMPRMVHTPWSNDAIPFATAAEIGTRKVICDHSTVGILVTCDGTICELPRSAYIEAEARVAKEMNEMHKPYVIVLNSANPASEYAHSLAYELEEKYGAPVALVNCAELSAEDIHHIMALMLSEFPVTEVRFELPRWVGMLERSHPLRTSLFESISHGTDDIFKTGDIKPVIERFGTGEDGSWTLKEIDAGTGIARVEVQFHPDVYFAVLTELTGLVIKDDADLFAQMRELAKTKLAYAKVAQALADVNETGYGIVMPDTSELHLEEPRIVKQAGGYGIKLRASAPSIHMVKAVIDTEINPVVGTELQSEEMVRYLLKEFEEDPTKIWNSNMFGKSLNELTSESIHT
ncbi:MAG: stage IV sporulation protein A, partial [Clostridia bacterium]|nr:stage IV sporulation protein A [Clostridia bacterium]